MSVDIHLQMVSPISQEELVEVISEAIGCVDVEEASLVGYNFTVIAHEDTKLSLHANKNGFPPMLHGASTPLNVAIGKRIVDTCGGMLATSDDYWDGSFDYSRLEVSDIPVGPLTSEEMEWGTKKACYSE